MHAKREIPASNCPSFVENMFYSANSASEQVDKEERDTFRVMTGLLDERAEKYETNRSRKEPVESRFKKRRRMGITDGEWVTVDTDGEFEYGGCRYRIDPGASQYQPIETPIGLLYDMDRILVTSNGFFDMNYDPVEVKKT